MGDVRQNLYIIFKIEGFRRIHLKEGFAWKKQLGYECKEARLLLFNGDGSLLLLLATVWQEVWISFVDKKGKKYYDASHTATGTFIVGDVSLSFWLSLGFMWDRCLASLLSLALLILAR